MIFTNIWELLADMKMTASDEILCADTPPNFGWVCVETEKMWEISILNAASSSKLGDEESQKVLARYFPTAQGRRNIKQMLNELPYLDRLVKLKAFW